MAELLKDLILFNLVELKLGAYGRLYRITSGLILLHRNCLSGSVKENQINYCFIIINNNQVRDSIMSLIVRAKADAQAADYFDQLYKHHGGIPAEH